MSWTVLEHPEFSAELRTMPAYIVDKLAEAVLMLEVAGPQLGRPLVDTLKGARHGNMKELRLSAVWRVAFAFDADRSAVILVGGSKAGVNQKRFYRELISVADRRFGEWIEAARR